MSKQLEALQKKAGAAGRRHRRLPPRRRRRAWRRTPGPTPKAAKAGARGRPEVRQIHEGLLRHPRCVPRLHHQGHRSAGRRFHWNYANPRDPGSPFVETGRPRRAARQGRLARLAHVQQRIQHRLSRFAHRSQDRTSTSSTRCPPPSTWRPRPVCKNTWTKSSNTVQGRDRSGRYFIGFKRKSWGKLKFGELFMPYKTSTDRLNPFNGELGNYPSIMGNTGGDNRVEFGTRFDHVDRLRLAHLAGLQLRSAVRLRTERRPEQRNDPAGLARLHRRQQPGQRQPACELRRRRLRRCLQRRPQVRERRPVSDGRL